MKIGDSGTKRVLTLCIIHKENKILLGMKKRGFGKDRWNGFGGKVEGGESIEEAAYRELQEEAGIRAHDAVKRGVLNFEFENDPEILEVHVFSASDFDGIPEETEEMRPRWFDIGEIPYKEMWPDDVHWLPRMLAGKNVKGNFFFKDKNTLLRYRVHES